MTNSFDRDVRRGVGARGSWWSNPIYIVFIIAVIIVAGWIFYSFSGAMYHAQAPSVTTTAPPTTEPTTPPKTP